MMAGMIGADLEQVRALAADFERAAAQLTQTSQKVRNGIQISAWVGPFAVRFRHTWDSDHSVKLRQAANALAAQAKQLRLEADQQDRASAASTGASMKPPVRVSDRDLVDFAETGASDRKGIVKDGYTRLDEAELKKLGITPGMLHDSRSGFDAKVYRDIHGRIIVSFGGTEGGLHGADADNDLAGANHYRLSEQAEQSVQLALALESSVGADNMILTGHSLGGRNAALASVATGARAVTFNAAGVSAGDHLYASTAGGASVSLAQYAVGTMGVGLAAPHVTNYYTDSDPLTFGQIVTSLPDALGTQHRVNSDKQGFDAHSDFEALNRGVPGD